MSKKTKTTKKGTRPEAATAVAEALKGKGKAKREPKAKKASALDAAARLLAETGDPMTCGEMIEQMAAKGYWESPKGKTPAATLYAAILREIGTKAKDSRFKKTERGKFASNVAR
jgi:hypothetical protein